MEYIHKRKSGLSSKRLACAVAAGILAVLILAYVIIAAIAAYIGNLEDDGYTLPDIDTGIGESLYGNYAVAYDVFEDTAVQAIDVSYLTKEGAADSTKVMRHYSMRRPSKESEFVFGYMDSNNKWVPYMPAISETNGFSYTDLYATDSSGYGIYRLTYLIVAVSVLYFDEKMELPAEGADRDKMLLRYGLEEESRQKITVHYLDGRGEEKKHEILIGDLAIDGSGYYFMVDDRDYVYSSMGSDFDYALGGFTSFIHSRLTAEGLSMDGAQEPYFTQEYKQWKNTLYTAYENPGMSVPDLSTVVFSGIEEEYIYEDVNYYEEKGLQSYPGKFSFKLDGTAPTKLRNILKSLTLCEKLDSPITVTSVGDTNWARLDGVYNYKVTEILAILTDGADITEAGTSVGDARYVKIKYDYDYKYEYYIEDHLQTDEGSFEGAVAVVDLDKIDTLIPEDTEGYTAEELEKLAQIKALLEGIKNGAIGEFSSPLTLNVKYSDKIADKYDVKYVITDIKMIYGADEDGKVTYIDKIAEDSIVNIAFELRHYTDSQNKKYTVIESGSETVNLAAITTEGTLSYSIKNALIGKGVGADLDITAYTESLYREFFTDYRTYTIESVDRFVTEELQVSFGFVNASKRNPFYGESLFINKLNGKLGLYALDSTACEYVVKLLGGISIESDSTTSMGLVGTETVAVGLTPENMLKYGLYANTIKFVLPRGIEEHPTIDGDYEFLGELAFTLYISDIKDGSRYVGSDMYDIIAKVDGDAFVFLDKTFVDFWARETLAAVHFEKIDKIGAEFYMSDFNGSYTFDVEHSYKPTEEGSNQLYDYMWLKMSMNGNTDLATDTLLKEMLLESGKSNIPLYNVYEATGGMYIDGLKDTADAVNFKSLLDVIYNTYYTGIIAPEEQSVIKKNGNMLMRFSFTINEREDDEGNVLSTRTYYFEFYKADDRRIMVSMYESGYKVDAVSDFYISTQAFKKIAYGFLGLLNGETVEGDIGYPK